MSKRRELLNWSIKFAERVSNPSKNLASHIAMRMYAGQFAEWCALNGWVYKEPPSVWIQNGDIDTLSSTEMLIEKFDPKTT